MQRVVTDHLRLPIGLEKVTGAAGSFGTSENKT